MAEVTNNNYDLSQIYARLEEKGLNRSQIEKLSQTHFQVIWNSIESGQEIDIEQINGWVLESADIIDEDESSIKKNENTYTDSNGDLITESYNGDVIAKKIIEHNEDGNNIITTISYNNGVISNKKVVINGNTATEINYDNVDGQIIITTENKGARKTTTTTVSNIDNDGNFTDEDFIERTETSQLSGQSKTTKLQNGRITVIENGKETVYDGASITEFNEGLLREYQEKSFEPDGEKIYMSTQKLVDKLPDYVDISTIIDKNTKNIINYFKINKSSLSNLSQIEMAYIKNFISGVVDSNESGSITDIELEAVSQYLQEQGIENADFKAFLEDIQKSNQNGNSLVSLNSTLNGRHIEYSDIAGDRTSRLVDEQGDELRISYYSNHDNKTIFKDYATYEMGNLAGRMGVTVTPEKNRAYKEKVMTAYSPKYQAQIEEYIVDYLYAKNTEMSEHYDDARGEWSLGDWIGDGIVNIFSSESAKDIALEAKKMQTKAAHMQASIKEDHTYREFKEKFMLELGTKNFNYLAAERFMRISQNYTTAIALQGQIDTLDKEINMITMFINDENIVKKFGSVYDLKIDTTFEDMKSYGINPPSNSLLDSETRQCVYMCELCRMIGDKNVAKSLIENYTQSKTELTDTDWLNFFNDLREQFVATRDSAIQGIEDSKEITYNDSRNTQISGLNNHSIGELKANYKASYKEVFGVDLKDEEMEKLIKAGSVVGNIAVNIAICAVSSFAAAALIARGARMLRGAAAMKNLSTGGKILYHGIKNTTEFLIDDGIRFVTYGSKGRQAMLDNMGGDFMHVIFANHVAGPIGRSVSNVIGKNVGKVFPKGEKITKLATNIGASEGTKVGGYTFLYDATSAIEYSQYRATDILNNIVKDKKFIALLKPKGNPTVSRAIDNLASDKSVANLVDGLMVLEYKINNKTMFALANSSKEIVYETENQEDIVKGLVSMCVEASTQSLEMADMRSNIQARAQNIQQQRHEQYQTASEKVYYPDDVQTLTAQNKSIKVHDGYVYEQKQDGTEVPIGVYYADVQTKTTDAEIA